LPVTSILGLSATIFSSKTGMRERSGVVLNLKNVAGERYRQDRVQNRFLRCRATFWIPSKRL
jgi:hypothetical protein